MKLKTLAIAVAMAAVPFAAQADVKFSGDVGVGYSSNNGADATFGQFGSEVNVDASHKTNGLTYYGHIELDYSNNAMEEARVGVKSDRIGDIRIGHLGDNGCARVEVGGDYSISKSHTIGGCQGASADGISYTKSMRGFEVSVSHVPMSGDDENSIGVSGKIGPASASIGYTTGAADVEGLALGIAGKVGPVEAGFRYNKLDADGSEAVHGINLNYNTRGGVSVYGGVGTSDNNDTMSIGVKKVIGTTDIFFEADDNGASSDATSYIAGMRHRF